MGVYDEVLDMTLGTMTFGHWIKDVWALRQKVTESVIVSKGDQMS